MRQRGIPHDQNLNGGAVYSTTPETPMPFLRLYYVENFERRAWRNFG